MAGEKKKPKQSYQTMHGAGGRPWPEPEDKARADAIRARPHEHLGLGVRPTKKRGAR